VFRSSKLIIAIKTTQDWVKMTKFWSFEPALNINIFKKYFTQVIFFWKWNSLKGSEEKLSKVDEIWTTLVHVIHE